MKMTERSKLQKEILILNASKTTNKICHRHKHK